MSRSLNRKTCFPKLLCCSVGQRSCRHRGWKDTANAGVLSGDLLFGFLGHSEKGGMRRKKRRHHIPS